MLNPVTLSPSFSSLDQKFPVCEKNTQAADLSSLKAKTITTNPSCMTRVWNLIQKVVKVATITLVSAFFFWINPSLVAISFIAGIIFDEHVEMATQKIKNVWKNQAVTGCIIGTFACALALPVTIATASILWSANFGSFLSKPNPSEGEKIQKLPVSESC